MYETLTKYLEHGPPPPYTPSPDDKPFRDSPYLQEYMKKYNAWRAYHSYWRPYINGKTGKYRAWYDYCITRQKEHDMHSKLRIDRIENPDWKLGSWS